MFPGNLDITEKIGNYLDLPIRFRFANKQPLDLSGFQISFGVANTIVLSNGAPGSTSCGTEGNVHVFSNSAFTSTLSNTYYLHATDTHYSNTFLLLTGTLNVAPGEPQEYEWFINGTWNDDSEI